MSEPARPPAKPITLLKIGTPAPHQSDDQMLCDRCGVEMCHMHAVWLCPACGFKTDCCGW